MFRNISSLLCIVCLVVNALTSNFARADAGIARIEYQCDAHEPVSGVVALRLAQALPGANLSKYYEGNARLEGPPRGLPKDGPPSHLPYGEFSFGVGKGGSLLERVLNFNRICFWSLAILDRVLGETDYLATAADSYKNCDLLAPDGAEIRVMAQGAAVSAGEGSSFIIAPPYYSCTLRVYLPRR